MNGYVSFGPKYKLTLLDAMYIYIVQSADSKGALRGTLQLLLCYRFLVTDFGILSTVIPFSLRS